jgi:hypothetical protein
LSCLVSGDQGQVKLRSLSRLPGCVRVPGCLCVHVVGLRLEKVQHCRVILCRHGYRYCHCRHCHAIDAVLHIYAEIIPNLLHNIYLLLLYTKLAEPSPECFYLSVGYRIQNARDMEYSTFKPGRVNQPMASAEWLSEFRSMNKEVLEKYQVC